MTPDDQNFNDAFTTPPEASNPPSGRWDPIPTLRPSGWRDGGSFRSATSGDTPDDSWNWTSGGKQAPGDPSPSDPKSPPQEDAELTLTRQWGLLSRFQQARGLGLSNRRSSSEDGSVRQDTPEEAPTQNRRKG